MSDTSPSSDAASFAAVQNLIPTLTSKAVGVRLDYQGAVGFITFSYQGRYLAQDVVIFIDPATRPVLVNAALEKIGVL